MVSLKTDGAARLQNMANTILVVDDEKNIVQLARLYLGNEGFNVVEAYDGKQALDQARAANPDLVVLDIMMPEMDGLSVCRELRKTSSVPVIMLTARDDDVDKIVGLEVGDIRLDPARREVFVAGNPVTLRAKEFDLLAAFMRYEGVVLDRERLLSMVWGQDFYGDTRTIDVHVAWLRDKLSGAQAKVQTVWGVGYKLVLDEQAATAKS